MEAPTEAEPQAQPEPSAPAAAEEDENDLLMAKAQSLMDKIIARRENSNPDLLHALATILETQESRLLFLTISLLEYSISTQLTIWF